MQRVKQLLSFQRTDNSGVLRLTSTPMSPQPTLPPELIEAIIDELGALRDTATLRSCALVSHTFLFPAQKYLFHSINLDRPHLSRKKIVQRFHKLLLDHPHLGTHVRALYLGDDTTGADDEIGSYTVSSSELWAPMKKGAQPKSLQLIPQILDRIPRLAALSVSFNPNMLRWGDIPPQTLEALYGVLGRESLREVALSFVPACPPELLWMLARLKVVTLACVELDAHHAAAIASAPSKTTAVNIETLILRATPPPTIQAFNRILTSAPHGASPLKSLAITPTFEPGFCEAVAELITHAGGNLVNFEWLPSIHFTSSSYPISFSPHIVPHLSSMRFSVSFRKSRTQASGPFGEVLRLLQGLLPPAPSDHGSHSFSTPAATSLQTVTIDCHCLRPRATRAPGTQAVSEKSVLRKMKAEWAPLDQALSTLAVSGDLEIGGPLREVRIRLSTKTSEEEDRDHFMRSFPYLMPELQSRGVTLSVTTSDEPTF